MRTISLTGPTLADSAFIQKALVCSALTGPQRKEDEARAQLVFALATLRDVVPS